MVASWLLHKRSCDLERNLIKKGVPKCFRTAGLRLENKIVEWGS